MNKKKEVKIKSKEKCKVKRKSLPFCYGNKCSNEQFFNCYPEFGICEENIEFEKRYKI